jgi:hypothetical protein
MMHAAYFEALFALHDFAGKWPAQFAIITAWATTGSDRPLSENEAADRQLKQEISRRRVWHQRVTGYCLKTGHAEPGWAVELSFSDACDLGQKFLQDAIYFVNDDRLYVSHCDLRREPVIVGGFRRRLRAG